MDYSLVYTDINVYFAKIYSIFAIPNTEKFHRTKILNIEFKL